jgi:GT2 family glycosyltransferase
MNNASENSKHPRVSVIVINLNGGDFLIPSIASAFAQEPLPEVILVDNGSTDGSLQLVESAFPQVRIIRNNSNLGFAGPANQGAALASGDFLLFLNNDARLEPGVLSRLLEAVESDKTVAACEPTMRRVDGDLDSAGSLFTKTGFLYHLTEDDLTSHRFGSDRFSLKGACLLVRADLFDRAGRFDDTFFAYFEETDLCWRLINMGYRLVHVNGAEVTHDVGRTTTAVFTSSHIDYLSFRNRISTIRKNGDAWFKCRVLPIHVVGCLSVAVAFTLKGKPQNALGIMRALKWHVRRSSKHLGSKTEAVPRHSFALLSSVTVPLKLSSAIRMLKVYLVRW